MLLGTDISYDVNESDMDDELALWLSEQEDSSGIDLSQYENSLDLEYQDFNDFDAQYGSEIVDINYQYEYSAIVGDFCYTLFEDEFVWALGDGAYCNYELTTGSKTKFTIELGEGFDYDAVKKIKFRQGLLKKKSCLSVPHNEVTLNIEENTSSGITGSLWAATETVGACQTNEFDFTLET